MRHLGLFTAFLLGIVCGASAQTFQSAAVQTVNGTPRIMATGDFNGDGKADVVYQDTAPNALTGGTLHVMFGNGDGTFRDVQQIALPLDVGARIAVADLNNDGFPDLLIGYYGFDSNFTPVEFTALINSADGTFGPPIFSPFPSVDEPETAAYHIAVADFDGDGKMDFIFTASAGLLLMRGDGAGHFTPKVLFTTQSDGDGANDVYVADFNEDGRADVAIDADFGVYYALNLGGGNFGPVTTIAQVLTNPPLGFGIADVNGDGHQDIIYGSNAEIYVAFGRGDGTFASPRASGTAATPSGYTYLALVDVNGDGRLDLVTSNGGSPIVELQDAQGQFNYAFGDVTAVGDIGFVAPVYADFDGDGVGDVVTGATGALVFSKGRADGTFNGARAIRAGATLDIQAADLNKDGFVDVVILNGDIGTYFGNLYTYLGDGTGAFTEFATPQNAPDTFAGHSTIADFNGDGIPDVFNAGYLLEGDGQGGLLPAVLIAAPPQGSEPEGFTVAADFNEDGIPDGVATTETNQPGTDPCTLAVGLSSGAGTWTTQQIILPVNPALGSGVCAGPLVAADLNRDGHMDLATASLSTIYIYLGDGSGKFTLGPVVPIGYSAGLDYGVQSEQNDLEGADLDGDGNVDLIVPIAGKNVIQIFYGRGDGTFEPAVSLPTAQDVRYVTVADMNGDGIPDMILGGHALVRILHGTGNRTFEATPTSYAGNPYPQKVRVADVNNDGHPDLLVPNGGYSSIAEPGETFTVLLNAAPPTSPDLLLPSLLCAPEPSAIGQPFTCTATFTPANNSAHPSGPVSFLLDGVAAGSAALSGNKALLAFPSTLSAGRHAITASFPGDTTFLAATASTSHFVSLAVPSVVLTGPLHVAFGQAVPLEVAVAGGAGLPTGTITFDDGSNQLARVAVTGGVAAYSISTLSPGTHLLQASYSGDGTYAGGLSNTLTLVVDPEPTSIVLQATPATAALGSAITLKATVSAPMGPLAGTVQFYVGGTPIATVGIDATGAATFTTTSFSLGVHAVTAQFAATASLGPSTSAGVQVTIVEIASTTSLSTTPNPSYPGQPVVLAASVTSASASQFLSGAIRLFDGNIALGDVPLNASGPTTLSVSNFAVGSHMIVASYLGNGSVLPSQSYAVQQVVLNSSFTLAPNPAKLTLRTQHHTTFSLTVTPVGLFKGVVTLSCGTLPAHATCRIKEPTITLTASGAAQTLSVYLDTSDVIGYAQNDNGPLKSRPSGSLFAAMMLPFVAGLALAKRGRGWRQMGRLLLLAGVFCGFAMEVTGCSGKYPASVAPGDYTLNFTGSSAAPPVDQTAPLQLTVTP